MKSSVRLAKWSGGTAVARGSTKRNNPLRIIDVLPSRGQVVVKLDTAGTRLSVKLTFNFPSP